MEYDFAPLFRSAIGFDRMIRLAGSAASAQSASSYPPYNIEKTSETDYTLTMAIAGFSVTDLDITLEDNNLLIRGNSPENDRQRQWLYRGIATRAFERRFTLADHTEVEEAQLENGLLVITLRRLLPEARKPVHIPIRNTPRHKAPIPPSPSSENVNQKNVHFGSSSRAA